MVFLQAFPDHSRQWSEMGALALTGAQPVQAEMASDAGQPLLPAVGVA